MIWPGLRSYSILTAWCARMIRSCHKPDSEPLLYYLEQTGCQGDELLYIGDSVYDRQCAAGAGTAFGLAGWGAQPGVSAPLIFSTPQQAAQILIG